MEVRTGTFSFGPMRGAGPRVDRRSFNFTAPVRQAVACLAGTSFGFSPRDDHHLGWVTVRLGTSIDDDVVTVEGTFGVRDWSDNWDDNYEGSIQFVLLLELETGFVPSNLSITGVEHNQVIQFFRSQLHLDPATARGDNAIGLVAGKNSVMRVYVDTQSVPDRPIIGSVSGTLEIRVGGVWTAVTRLNGPIVPIIDAAIRRGNRDDTLNFFIPGAFCAGNLEYRVRVFDAAHPDQPGFTSGTFQDTIRFVPVRPLNVRGVGVHYVGRDSSGSPTNITAPTVADARSTLAFVLKSYPVGQLNIVGFDVIDYDGDFTSSSGGGCGSGWGGLLSRLREMQGDDESVYYGLVPSGVPTSGTIGCGGGDGRVGAGFVNDGTTAAQEIGHAFGRDHAPCGDPGNVDPNYPVYGALPMGSIGEFGIDDSGNVQDPNTARDFMSYCGPAWVSPYTYQGLRGDFPPVSPSPRLQALAYGPAEHREVRCEHLFLNFRIYRSGQVRIFPSFHYQAMPRPKRGRLTPYAIELRDRHNRTLYSQRVELTDPHGTMDTAALDFYKPVPLNPETALLVITCGDRGECEQKELIAVDVPQEAPKVRLTTPTYTQELSGKLRLAWEAESTGKVLYFLVRYSNDDGATWRTLAPRTNKTEFLVDFDQLQGGERCRLAVLVTEGIRTGSAVSEPFSVQQRPRQTIIAPPEGGTVFGPGDVVRLVGDAFSPHFGSVDGIELEWHSDLDGPLGQGHELVTASLRPGRHRITVEAPDGHGGKCVAEISIEVKATLSRKHTSHTHPDHSSKDHDIGRLSPKWEEKSHHGD